MHAPRAFRPIYNNTIIYKPNDKKILLGLTRAITTEMILFQI